MSPATRPDSELDGVIAEITVDCDDDDEALVAFENAFDEEVSFPIPGTVLGEDVEIISVATSAGRRELIATCRRAGRRHQIALLDLDLHPAEPASRLLAAYRRWLS